MPTNSNVFFYCLTAPPPGMLTWKNQSLQYRDRVSHTGELWKTQSPHTPQHRAHTQGTLKSFKVHTHHNTVLTHRGTLKNSNSSHITAQGSHKGTLKNFKVPTHHTTEHTHRRTLKIFKAPHSRELWKSSKSPHTQYRDFSWRTNLSSTVTKPHTPGNYENLQSLHTSHSTEPTHRELRKFSKSLHITEPTHQGTLKIFKVSTHHRLDTTGSFENF